MFLATNTGAPSTARPILHRTETPSLHKRLQQSEDTRNASNQAIATNRARLSAARPARRRTRLRRRRAARRARSRRGAGRGSRDDTRRRGAGARRRRRYEHRLRATTAATTAAAAAAALDQRARRRAVALVDTVHVVPVLDVGTPDVGVQALELVDGDAPLLGEGLAGVAWVRGGAEAFAVGGEGGGEKGESGEKEGGAHGGGLVGGWWW
jgi:hypothetical protein